LSRRLKSPEPQEPQEPLTPPPPIPEPIPEIIPEPVIEPEPLPEPIPEPLPEPIPEPPEIIPPEVIVNETPAPPEFDTVTPPDFETIAPVEPDFDPVAPLDVEPVDIDPIAPPAPVYEPVERPQFETVTPDRPDFETPDFEAVAPEAPDFEQPLGPVYAPPDQPAIGPVGGPDRPDLDIDVAIDVPDIPRIVFQTPPPDRPRDDTPDRPIATDRPSILASDDDAQTPDELARAVPDDQSDQLLTDNLGRPQGERDPNTAGPLFGGGNTPPSGGSQLGGPQRNGDWAASVTGADGLGEGYDGLVLDIRCREAGRTHEDCPEYLRSFQGRGSDGFERFGAHSNAGIPSNGGGRGGGGGSNNPNNIGGGNDLWTGSGIGDNSVNAGGPSTTILDDVNVHSDFGRITPEGESGRVRDLFGEQPQPDLDENDILQLPPPEDE